MPYKPIVGPRGQLSFDLRQVNMEDWGSPTVNEDPQQLSFDNFRPIRGLKPSWEPGEFEEWKQGKLTGLGTEFGRNRQMQYNMRGVPGGPVAPGKGINPALLALKGLL